VTSARRSAAAGKARRSVAGRRKKR
jgi:hypothetical protein